MIRVVKRTELPQKSILLLRLGAILLALFAGGIFVALLGFSPLKVYATILIGSFRSKLAIQSCVRKIIPLLITSLGVSMAFKMKFWNIGAEGQMIMGAIFSSYFALFHDNWPKPILLIVMLFAGIVGGGLWGVIPAYFKCKYETNETLLTLMFNYIALYFVSFFRDGPWRDPTNPGYAKTATFSKNAILPDVFGVHIGWIFAVLLVGFAYFYLKYSKQGYEMAVVGESRATAYYSGMNVKRVIIRTMLLSGAISGIAGMAQASGSDGTLAMGVAGGVGFTAIIVAWIGNLNPISIFIVTVMFGILEKGSSVIETQFRISRDSADVLQGIILFFIIGCEFFTRYKFVMKREESR